MTKNNVTPIKESEPTQVFSYEVKMLVHIVAENAEAARTQLDEKGGIVTKRDVELLNAIPLFGEVKE